MSDRKELLNEAKCLKERCWKLSRPIGTALAGSLQSASYDLESAENNVRTWADSLAHDVRRLLDDLSEGRSCHLSRNPPPPTSHRSRRDHPNRKETS